MRHRQIDRLPLGQPGIELVSHLNWADKRACPTTCTAFGIYYGWLLPQSGLELARFPFQRHKFSGKHDLYVLVK
jgi:hypothetical protein